MVRCFYHCLNSYIPETFKEFVPSIPEHRGRLEDNITPRVCLSDSMEGCFSSMGSIDTFNIPVTVCSAYVDDSMLIPPEVLYEKYHVLDALSTHEYWCLHSLTMSVDRFILTSFMCDNYYVVENEKKPEIIKWICDRVNIDASILENFWAVELVNEVVPSLGLDPDDMGFDGIRIIYSIRLRRE